MHVCSALRIVGRSSCRAWAGRAGNGCPIRVLGRSGICSTNTPFRSASHDVYLQGNGRAGVQEASLSVPRQLVGKGESVRAACERLRRTTMLARCLRGSSMGPQVTRGVPGERHPASATCRKRGLATDTSTKSRAICPGPMLWRYERQDRGAIRTRAFRLDRYDRR